MVGVPREAESKWIFESRELSMEPKCKYEGVRLWCTVFAFGMMQAPITVLFTGSVQDFGVLNRTIDRGLVDTVW